MNIPPISQLSCSCAYSNVPYHVVYHVRTWISGAAGAASAILHQNKTLAHNSTMRTRPSSFIHSITSLKRSALMIFAHIEKPVDVKVSRNVFCAWISTAASWTVDSASMTTHRAWKPQLRRTVSECVVYIFKAFSWNLKNISAYLSSLQRPRVPVRPCCISPPLPHPISCHISILSCQ